ncbi:hypothetical protein ACFL6Y_06835 [Elusimicrobiota bacterium]
MQTPEFDKKIDDLKKAVETNRSVWRKTLEFNEAKWREQVFIKDNAIAALKKELDSTNSRWESEYKDKTRALDDIKDTCASLKLKLTKLEEDTKNKAEKIDSLKNELQSKKHELETKLDEKDVSARAVNTKVSDQQEEIKIYKARLAEEQQRWDEVMKMKEKDFEVLKRELEQKAKDWEGQYQKDEAEIQIVREGRGKLEQKVEDLNSKLRTQEIKSREQVEVRDEQIVALKKELNLIESTWKEKFRMKESEVDNIRREMEDYIKEMSAHADNPGSKIAPDTADQAQAAKTRDKNEFTNEKPGDETPESKKKWGIF